MAWEAGTDSDRGSECFENELKKHCFGFFGKRGHKLEVRGRWTDAGDELALLGVNPIRLG